MWAALGHAQPIDRIVFEQPRLQLLPLPAAQARAKLLALLQFALRARSEALPFMPKAGLAFARIEDPAKAHKKALDSWDSDFGEGRDAWVRRRPARRAPFEDALATERFALLARELFDGLPGVSAADQEAEAEVVDD